MVESIKYFSVAFSWDFGEEVQRNGVSRRRMKGKCEIISRCEHV